MIEPVRKVLAFIGWRIVKLLMWFRYRFTLSGLEIFDDPDFDTSKGLFVLPNHPAGIDPFILILLLEKRYKLRPLVNERYFRPWFNRFILSLVRSVQVDEFGDLASYAKKEQLFQMMEGVAEEARQGGTFLVYPAGRLKYTPDEKVGGKSLAYTLVQKAPQAQIVLVRITGLFGSRHSRVRPKDPFHRRPEFLLGLPLLLQNLFFFIPKREIRIEFCLPDASFPRGGSKIAFNRALEEFYNQYRGEKGGVVAREPINQVPYAFWSTHVSEPKTPLVRGKPSALLEVGQEMKERVIQEIRDLRGDPNLEIHEHDDLIYDVGLDSLEIMSIYSFLKDNYSIESGIIPKDLVYVQDIFKVALGKPLG